LFFSADTICLFILTVIFPICPGLAGTGMSLLNFIGATDDCGGKRSIRCAKLESNHHYQQPTPPPSGTTWLFIEHVKNFLQQ